MSRSDDEVERRSQADEGQIPADGRLPSDIERQLLEVAGFTRAELYERRGAIPDRGLVALLSAGDEVFEVAADHAKIRRADGSIQSLWNLRRLPSWVTRAEEPPSAP